MNSFRDWIAEMPDLEVDDDFDAEDAAEEEWWYDTNPEESWQQLLAEN